MATTNKYTPAQIVVFHAAESAGLSALLTLMVAVVQYVSTNGLNFAGLGAVLGTSFLAQMLMIYKSVAANPQTAQAAIDTEQQIAAAVPPQFVINASELAAQTVQQLDLAQLAALLKEELVKGSQAPAPATTDMASMATRPALEVVRKPSTGGTGG